MVVERELMCKGVHLDVICKECVEVIATGSQLSQVIGVHKGKKIFCHQKHPAAYSESRASVLPV